MKVWLGAAAALSGAGTLVYLLVRSSRRVQGDGTPSKAFETHTAQGCTAESSEDSQDASLKKDGSCGRINGHLPMEGHADSVSGMTNSAECYKETKQQNLSERTLTSGETCDVNASVERLSNNLDENLSELVSAIQNKIVVKEDNISNTSTCEEVNVTPHSVDKEILQPTAVKGIVTNIVHTRDKHQEAAMPGPEKDGETRECISTYAVEEKKIVASGKKEFPNSASNQEIICSDTYFSSLEGTACMAQTTETSLSAPEPVVEELSQCLILKPQCDPSCCEGHGETCHHDAATVPSEFTQFPNENYVTLNTEEATQKSTQMENSGMPPERHYTLVLKSNQEDFCISGKHIHGPSPTEPPFAETHIEGQERGAELNKDEPGTCIVTIEQREKVYEKQMPPSPLASSQEECRLRNESVNSECSAAAGKDCCGDSEADEMTTSDNTKEGTVLETDGRMEQPVGTATLQIPTTEKEWRSIKEDTTLDQGQSDSKQEVPQEQKRNAIEQEKSNEEQEHSGDQQVAPEEEEQSSCKQHEVPQEQKRNASEQEKNNEGQKHSGIEQSAHNEEQSSCKQQEVPQEQKQGHGQEKRQTQKQEKSESKQEVVMQKQEVYQKEKESGSVQEVTLKQEQKDNKQGEIQKQEQSSSKQATRQTPKQSGKKQLGTAQKQEQKSSKQHKAPVEHKQSNSNKQVATTQKQEQKEGTQKQKENDKKQKVTQKEEQSSQKEGTQKQKESDKKQKVTQKEAKSSHKQDTGMQKQEESDLKQQVTQREEQMSHGKEVTSPEQSAKDQVTGDQMTLSPSRCNNNGNGGGGSKKGTMRSRGDSASADLDCDLGSEQDNLNCDSSSLKSMDSGQGSSEIEPETLFVPSTFPVANQEQYIFYDFEIPQMLVGRLIGRKGAFINKIKAATEATVIVHPHKNRKLKLCSVEGTKQQVNAALEMIREHFPESQYPDITLQQVSSQHQHLPVIQPTLNAPSMQIELSAGVVVEVRVSAVVSGGELWVQQPLHPSYSALHRLQTCMNLNYGDGSNTPPLPNPISDGTVCVAHIKDHWMRCQVLSSLGGMSLVLPLDVGGTVSLPSSSLRQIRYDYMTLPFQATQCFLHGLQPMEGDTWSDIATSVMEELVRGVILFAVVVSYTEDYVPLVNLYRRDQDYFVLLNEKLVELGHAQWISPQPSS